MVPGERKDVTRLLTKHKWVQIRTINLAGPSSPPFGIIVLALSLSSSLLISFFLSFLFSTYLPPPPPSSSPFPPLPSSLILPDGDRSLGMVIVSGKVRNKDGTTVEGIFIQKILPGSLTDKDGR